MTPRKFLLFACSTTLYFTTTFTNNFDPLLDELRTTRGDASAQHRLACAEKSKTLRDEFTGIILNKDKQTPEAVFEKLREFGNKMSAFEKECYVAEYEELVKAHRDALQIIQEDPTERFRKNQEACKDFERAVRNGFLYRYGKELFLERLAKAKAIEGIEERVGMGEYRTIQQSRTVKEAREDIRKDCLKSLEGDRKHVKGKCSQCPLLVPLLLQKMAQLEQEIKDYQIPSEK